MGKFGELIHRLKPAIMMVCVQVSLAGVNIFYKLAGNVGMSVRVLIAYRFIFAAASVVPIAIIFERKNRPKITMKVLVLSFLCGLLGGSMAQNLFGQSLALTSATFPAAMTNVIPAVTFLLAVILRMERMAIKTWAGGAKVVGTCGCIGGAMLLTFFKGVEIKIWSSPVNLLDVFSHKIDHPTKQPEPNSILGLLLALCMCIGASISLILQAKLSKIYPCHYSSTALISIMGAIQATVFALCTVRESSQWRLGWDIRLLSAAYMGVVASGVMWALTMLCVRMTGPLYVSVFNPLMLVVVAIAGSLLLDEKLRLGTVLGGVLIICGLYTVLWGKSKETRRSRRLAPSRSFQGSTREEQQNETADNPGGPVNIAVTPSFVPEPEMLDDLDAREEEDVESQVPKLAKN